MGMGTSQAEKALFENGTSRTAKLKEMCGVLSQIQTCLCLSSGPIPQVLRSLTCVFERVPDAVSILVS